MIRRLALPIARLSLVAAVVLTTGGCCRCWWPGPMPSAATTSTGGDGAGGGSGLDGGGALTAPGTAKKASLSRAAFSADPGAPLHGAVMVAPRDHDDPLFFDAARGKQRRFVPHSATSAAAMFNGDIVVAANTGIWSHDPVNLARGARIVAPPVLAMAASPDGRTLAYASGIKGSSVASLHVISYPEGKAVAVFQGIDLPFRLRFSPDGKRLVVASRSAETVTLVDLASKRVLRHDTDDDVNDAIALPGEGDLVAYANDGDEAGVQAMSRRKKVFSTVPFMREYKGFSLTPITGSRKHVLTMLRDQNAVAFDPLGGVFFAGGDDNLVWRFRGVTGPSPSMDPPIDLDGNVEEILCTHKPAPGQTEASIVVALDTLGIHVITPDGKEQASLEALNWSALSSPIRIALTPDDVVIAVMGGLLARFNPSDASVSASHEYPYFPPSWHFSTTEQDTVIIAGGAPTFVHRVVHSADTADTVTTVVGTIALDPVEIVAFASGTRLLFGAAPGGRLRLVYYVPSSGTIEPPLDILYAGLPARVARRKDGKGIGIVDAEGRVFEVTETPRGAARVGHAPRALQPTERLAWDDPAQRWTIADPTGKATPIDPP